MNLNELFIDKGIYQLKINKEDIFLCEECHTRYIGKLVRYKYISKDLYERTNTQYFLNDYRQGDLKEVFVNRDNYEMLGVIGNNFRLKDKYILKEK